MNLCESCRKTEVQNSHKIRDIKLINPEATLKDFGHYVMKPYVNMCTPCSDEFLGVANELETIVRNRMVVN